MSRSSAARVSPGIPKSTSRLRFATPAPRSVATAARTVLGRRAPLEHRELARAEALGAERDAHAAAREHVRERVVDGLGIRLHRDLGRRRQPGEQPIEQRRRRAASACRRRRRRSRAARASTRALAARAPRARRRRRRACLSLVPGHRHEVAVAAAMRAERDVDVEVRDRAARQSPPTWGISARVGLPIPSSMRSAEHLDSPHRPLAERARPRARRHARLADLARARRRRRRSRDDRRSVSRSRWSRSLHFTPAPGRGSATRQLRGCRGGRSGERFLERSSCAELERKRRHHHVARAVGVGARARAAAPAG